MAWIESHTDLASHPKVRRLARALNISVPAAIGHLHLLWYWAWDFAKDGRLCGMDQEDIADAAMWDREPSELVDALIRSRWIDDEDGLRLHDWDDYSGRQIKRLEEEAQRKRAMRKRPSKSAPETDVGSPSGGRPADVLKPSDDNPVDVPWTSTTRPPDVQGTSCVTEQNITEQNINRTEQKEGEDFKPSPPPPNPFRIYEQEGFGLLSPVVADKLNDLIDDFGDRWVCEALKAARLAGKRSIPYVTSILNRYRSEGVDEPWLKERTRKPDRTKSGKPALSVVDNDETEELTSEEVNDMLFLALKLDLGREPTDEEKEACLRRNGQEIPA